MKKFILRIIHQPKINWTVKEQQSDSISIILIIPTNDKVDPIRWESDVKKNITIEILLNKTALKAGEIIWK